MLSVRPHFSYQKNIFFTGGTVRLVEEIIDELIHSVDPQSVMIKALLLLKISLQIYLMFY